MKELIVSLCIVLLGLTACFTPPIETIPPTQTPTPVSPTETSTPPPQTDTPTPHPSTNTPEPTATATTAYTPTPDISREQVEVAYEDRVIRGTMLGDGDIVVILAPMWGLTRSSWMAFAKHIAGLGYTALAIDFPGAGASSGEFSFTKVNFDVVAVIDFLKEHSYEHIVCIGASLGASACYEAALLRPELAGLVIIAAPNPTTAEAAATLLMPKLFVVGNEPDVKNEMTEDFKLLSEPKEFKLVRDPAHGTDLLQSGAKEEFRDILVEFLESLR